MLKRWLLVTLLLYLLLSWSYFGIGILGHPGRLKGIGTDPISYLWYLHWWPYAISHHLNPFISQWVWAPSGYNLTRSTSIFGIYLLSLPLQLVTNTITAYNILTIFAPGLAAWTMCLLCFYLTRSWLPAWLGGYLFGFSAYMIAQTSSHANLTVGVFLLPLTIGLVLLYLEEKISSLNVIIGITVAMTLLFLISAEIAVTFSACMLIAFIAAWLCYPLVRRRAEKLIIVMLIATLICILLLSPFLYYFLTDTINGAYLNRPHDSPNDLLSFITPEQFMQFITPFTVKLSNHFISTVAEHNGYLGFPLIILIALFGWRHWHKKGTKYLLSLVLIYACLSLSSTWFFNGKKLFVFFPSHCFFYWLPLVKHSLASRYALYTNFVIAIVVTLWLHRHHPSRYVNVAKYLLALLAIILLLPCIKPIKKLHSERWHRIYIQLDYSKPFFTDTRLYKKWLNHGENILIIPTGTATWYQLQSDFYFKLAMTYLGAPPLVKKQSDIFARVNKKKPSNHATAAQFKQFLHQRQINGVIITDDNYQAIRALLEQLAIKPVHVGGIWLYRFTNAY